MSLTLRRLRLSDNKAIADLIRAVFREFRIDRPGTVYTDPTTDNLFELFSRPDAVYWIAEENEEIIGGCGVYPTPELPEGCAELVKFYVRAESRGKGTGYKLMQKCIESAKELKYKKLYLETLPELSKAVSMYERAGFKHIPKRLGESGHYSCYIWMLMEL